jgi:hypothetical protein
VSSSKHGDVLRVLAGGGAAANQLEYVSRYGAAARPQVEDDETVPNKAVTVSGSGAGPELGPDSTMTIGAAAATTAAAAAVPPSPAAAVGEGVDVGGLTAPVDASEQAFSVLSDLVQARTGVGIMGTPVGVNNNNNNSIGSSSDNSCNNCSSSDGGNSSGVSGVRVCDSGFNS